MIKAKKLNEEATIYNLVLNECYVGEAKEEYIQLSNNLKIKTGQKRKGFVAVRIKRLSPPNMVEVEVVNEAYTIVSEIEPKTKLYLKNDIMKKLEPKIRKTASMIKDAAESGRNIFLRHHADADGYCGALALESVIMPLIEKKTNKVWQNYRRMPMRAPYYDYADALKDISLFKEKLAFHKKPLLIIVDNGSGEQDLLSLKRVKLYNVDIIIIDHHLFSKEVDELVEVHVNPRVAGGEGDICSGMLGYEIASQMGGPDPMYAAVAGIADMSKDEFVEPYVKLTGKNRKLLENVATCLDFEAYNLRFMESNAIYDLFNEKQEQVINLVLPKIEKSIEEYKVVIKKFLKVEKLKKGTLTTLDLDKTVLMGKYPTSGKVVGIARRMQNGPGVTLGIAEDFITIRVDGVKFSLEKLMSTLKKKFPYAMINGGGHDYAATIKFIPAAKEEVKKEFFNYIKGL